MRSALDSTSNTPAVLFLSACKITRASGVMRHPQRASASKVLLHLAPSNARILNEMFQQAVAMGKSTPSSASSSSPYAAYFSAEPVIDALLLIITFQPVLANLYFGGDVSGLPYQASMLLHASFIVLSGSIKAARAHDKHTEAQKAASISGKENTETHFESLSSADVYKFPFMASASLLSLFFALQYFKDWVNFLLSLYFSAIGVFALFAIAEPYVSKHSPV